MPAGASRYLDIAAELRKRIVDDREWEPGTKLPRMSDLAREYGVNRDTLARAIAILEAEGLVWAVPRRGTVVRHGMVQAAEAARQRGQAQPRHRQPRLQLPVSVGPGSVEAPHHAYGEARENDRPPAGQDAWRGRGIRGDAKVPGHRPGD